MVTNANVQINKNAVFTIELFLLSEFLIKLGISYLILWGPKQMAMTVFVFELIRTFGSKIKGIKFTPVPSKRPLSFISLSKRTLELFLFPKLVCSGNERHYRVNRARYKPNGTVNKILAFESISFNLTPGLRCARNSKLDSPL